MAFHCLSTRVRKATGFSPAVGCRPCFPRRKRVAPRADTPRVRTWPATSRVPAILSKFGASRQDAQAWSLGVGRINRCSEIVLDVAAQGRRPTSTSNAPSAARVMLPKQGQAHNDDRIQDNIMFQEHKRAECRRGGIYCVFKHCPRGGGGASESEGNRRDGRTRQEWICPASNWSKDCCEAGCVNKPVRGSSMWRRGYEECVNGGECVWRWTCKS